LRTTKAIGSMRKSLQLSLKPISTGRPATNRKSKAWRPISTSTLMRRTLLLGKAR
jgi:hypothetical protein